MDILLDNNIENRNENILFCKNIEYIIQKYDKKYLIVINKLASLISKFHSTLKKLINDISNVSITLGNQTINSKSLILEMKIDDEKYFQLNDRLEMINDTKKFIDNNLSITNKYLNIFITEVKQNFKELKILRNQKMKQIFSNNSNIKYNSISKDKSNNEYIIYSPDLNESNYDKKYIPIRNIFNNYDLNKNNSMTGNFKKTLKNNFFNYYKPINNNLNFGTNDNENIFNNYKANYLSPNQNLNKNYKKINFNKSQDGIPSKYNNAHNNTRNYSSLINEKTSRNKTIFTKGSEIKNNSCLSFKSPKISNNNNKYSKLLNGNNNNNNENKKKLNTVDRNKIVTHCGTKNNNYINNNNIELQLAYKVIEFISILNKVQSSINNNLDLNNQKDKFEMLKDNIESLTNKVIKQNNSGNNNKNIINNNFIYNSDIINNKSDNNNNNSNNENIKDQINQLRIRNKDLELLLKKKDKENQKLLNQIKSINFSVKKDLNSETNNIKVFKNSVLINNKVEEIKKLTNENKNYIDQIKFLKRENEILKNNNYNNRISNSNNNKERNNINKELLFKSTDFNIKNNINNKENIINILQEKEKIIKELKNNNNILRKKNLLLEKEINIFKISSKNKKLKISKN